MARSIFSALRYQEERFERVDYSETAWPDIDRGVLVSWWRAKRPELAGDDGPQMLSPEILLGIFRDLLESTNRSQQCFCLPLGALVDA